MVAPSNKRRNKNEQQNVRLPLLGSYTNRFYSATKDQRFVNMFPETRKVEAIESTKIFLNKRPGLTLYRDFGTGEGRGACHFNNKLYVAVGNTVYEDAVTPVAKVTLTSSTGPIGMIVGNSSTLGDYLFICDGTGGWVIKNDGTVLTIVVDSIRDVTITAGGSGFADGTYTLGVTGGSGTGFTGTYTCAGGVVTQITITAAGTGYATVPTISFPSGGGSGASGIAYTNAFPVPHVPSPTIIDGYVVLAQRADVYNCVLDEPTKWDASNYLTAEIFPDQVVALARQNNQVVVFGENSTEFFYDAANVSGSPLSRNESTVIQLGNAAPYAVYQNEKSCMFVAQSDSGGRAVWEIQGFQPKKVSDEFIEKILDAETDMTDVRGFGIRTMGHLFYVINLPTLNRTLVYDTEEKLWHEWSSNNAGSHIAFQYNFAVDKHQGYMYVLHNSDGTLNKVDVTSYQDNGVSILVDVTTNRYDMDTIKRKFMSNLRIVSDRYEAGNSIDVRWTDNDYQSWSNTKIISLIDDFPNFARLGSFRRRAFNLKHNLNYPLRLESIEVSYYEGDH